MKSIKEMSMMELGGFLCDALKSNDIPVVLSGGSCVEIYSRGEYTSYDLDLINQYNTQFKKIKKVMEELGFKEKDRYFVHEETHLFVEFPSGPLGVGDAPVTDIAEIDTEAGVLRLLTPTDCIKDRLAAYYHWRDEQSLLQALWVAQQNPFDMQNIETWSKKEKSEDKFKKFVEMLRESGSRT
ncbi:MAG: hypothetical protein A2023_07280 [Sulfuricurvum sp. GWF2_44_89]|uniref:UbiD family decarboxylase n=1 Tax=Sulfuricurvum kujiense TaxID=148813 RepID=A0A2D3WG32_9BACT|nr:MULTISPECIES: hypothetical protein [Sulfuricurvum]OHD78278.1 MAG: hypothetical protein A2023_07280 [Sulfuricurvum sp. GWF2_44_89]OHD91585.1 MAG: hypothetical protein A2517_07220 [Sulfuricurvum sp. RIFOXYD12_FULL_44_77]OHD94126.1 MAG: hypothetical protein A2552_01640 [Sulfuricurvum sp. RIFOXYD2_FULL_44_160]DAB38865.1 MAG TPA: hypothetical protein CFH83_03895 [Sulfuricurvum kujiense]